MSPPGHNTQRYSYTGTQTQIHKAKQQSALNSDQVHDTQIPVVSLQSEESRGLAMDDQCETEHITVTMEPTGATRIIIGPLGLSSPRVAYSPGHFTIYTGNNFTGTVQLFRAPKKPPMKAWNYASYPTAI